MDVERGNVEAVLFDLDGVLIDSFDAWLTAFNKTLKDSGEEPLEREDFREKHWGQRLKISLKDEGLDAQSEKCCLKIFEKNIDKIKLKTGAKPLLWFIKRKGIKLGVVTNTSLPQTKIILNKKGLKQFLDVIVSADQVGRPKPSPDPVFKACKELNKDPARTVFVGDSTEDFEAGKAAGCITVGLRTDLDYRIDKLLDLKQIIRCLTS